MGVVQARAVTPRRAPLGPWLTSLGIAIGALAEGSVRSNARRALAAGASSDDIRQVALCAITTRGFPTAIAALGWIDEVIGDATTEQE